LVLSLIFNLRRQGRGPRGRCALDGL
jgi:hypothetical protein